jgi:hypothetical protein
MTRAEQIERTLDDHFVEIGTIPVVKSLGVWIADIDTLHTPFGYNRPIWIDHRSFVAFCPELIEQTTAELSDQDLADYLTCVKVQLDYYIAHYEMTDEESTEWFDRYLANEFLGSMALMNEIQLNWLDRKASH